MDQAAFMKDGKNHSHWEPSARDAAALAQTFPGAAKTAGLGGIIVNRCRGSEGRQEFLGPIISERTG
jgi:hypothetical protein